MYLLQAIPAHVQIVGKSFHRKAYSTSILSDNRYSDYHIFKLHRSFFKFQKNTVIQINSVTTDTVPYQIDIIRAVI